MKLGSQMVLSEERLVHLHKYSRGEGWHTCRARSRIECGRSCCWICGVLLFRMKNKPVADQGSICSCLLFRGCIDDHQDLPVGSAGVAPGFEQIRDKSGSAICAGVDKVQAGGNLLCTAHSEERGTRTYAQELGKDG